MRNFWSLHAGEAFVAQKLFEELNELDKKSKKKSKKKSNHRYQVCIPLNSQLPGSDLILADFEKGSCVTIQVKSSSQPMKAEKGKKEGWFRVKRDYLEEKDNLKYKVDFYVFLIDALSNELKKENSFIIVPSEDLKQKVKRKTRFSKKTFDFHFKVESAKEVKEREKSRPLPCCSKISEGDIVHDDRNVDNECYLEHLDNFDQIKDKLALLTASKRGGSDPI